MNPTLRGVARSWTMYLSFGTVALGIVQAGLPAILQSPDLHVPTWVQGLATMIIGLLIAWCRFVTDRSLAEKGAQPDGTGPDH